MKYHLSSQSTVLSFRAFADQMVPWATVILAFFFVAAMIVGLI